MVLGLPERATMEEIRSAYRALIRKWHPDNFTANPEKCKEMTTKIIAAYRTINDYCKNYKFSFSLNVIYCPVENYVPTCSPEAISLRILAKLP